MDGGTDFDDVRRDPDPVRRGRRATELLALYQQRSTELARLRKAAIEEAHRDQGMSYTEIATAIGLTKGRITQIRSTATPGPERALFGVGPVSVGVPYRYRTTDRERPLIAAEDARTAEQMEGLLGTLGFVVTRYQIEPDREDPPPGDTVVVCGPKSAPVGNSLFDRDPALRMIEDKGRWWLEHRESGERTGSPADDDPTRSTDLAYVARHTEGSRVIVHIAGIHAIGSLGAVHYLTAHMADLVNEIGDRSFSLTVWGDYDGLTITGSQLVAGPYVW